MKKKKWALFPFVIAIVISLAGCAENQIPEMTDEQIYDISEYVAFTLMKYDASRRSRLVALTEEDWIEKEPISTPEPKPEEEGMKPVVDTPVIDMTTGDGDEEPVETVLALADGLKLIYVGYETTDMYPTDIANSYFSLFATSGKQLLVLKFQLMNEFNADADVNMLSSDESFTVTVNKEYIRKAFTTMLDNDLATYVGTVPAGQSREVVLIIEVDSTMVNQISTIDIKIQNELKKHTIRVF